jgi:oligoribonuclease
MNDKKTHLVWMDLEMTGLNPDTDQILEIAVVITDKHLNILAEGPELAIFQPDPILLTMNEWCVKQHTKSGLVARVQQSTVSVAEAEQEVLSFIQAHVPPQTSPLCGNSICQDRRFLYRWMPKLEAYFHYRNLDVSTVKVLAQHWQPGLVQQFKKKTPHLAMGDIKESIQELQFYREKFFHIV